MNEALSVTNSLLSAEGGDEPYRHWLLSNILTDDTLEGILRLPIPVPDVIHDGWRANYKEDRIFFDPARCEESAACRSVVSAFKDNAVKSTIEKICDVDLSDSLLRIEYTLDSDGFYLKPHKDLDVKLFSLMIYLSKEPELADAGTDMYFPDLKRRKTAPFGPNLGMIFIPGDDTWHGLEPRKIHGIRRSLIVNYVTQEWHARDEIS